MKRIIIGGIIVFVFGLFVPQIAQAQGTLYLSSLSTNATGSVSVGSDSWLAAGFFTGNNTSGYYLNSVQLAMTDASGNPSGFTVMIYTEVGGAGVNPGSGLGTLTGSANPAASGIYTYSAASELSLSPSTIYFIVITAGTTVANGAYNLSESAYPPSSGNGWGADNALLRSSNGTSGWSPTTYLGIAQFAIYATPVPEPNVIGLLALGGLFVGLRRLKARAINRA